MSSENPTGADNQQERLGSQDWLSTIPHDVGHYIAGFVEGEGSFNVPIIREHDRCLPWRITLSFNVSQRGAEMPQFLKHTLGVGRVRGRRDGIFYYEVTRSDQLDERIFPFFETYPLRGPKARDLELFREITKLVRLGRHKSPAGIEEILVIRAPMNRGGKRRRCDEEIIALLRSENPQRPYAELPFEAEG
jgi:LAGLIDADG endonuclease